jgi:hypothetical protein
MDNKKFEALIELIINENEEQAKALFHDIVVEKSREIYESMMYDEGMDEGMGGQVGDLLDEINAEESGVVEGDDEEEFDIAADDDGEEEIVDIEADGDMDGGEEDLEGRVVEIEDKLDQLMAEFEEIMGGDAGDDVEDMGGDEDFGAEEGEEDFGGEEEAMMEAVQLKKIGGETYNKFGQMGDNGDQTKSPGLQGSGQAGMDSKPVKFAGSSESVPTSAKAPSNAYTKGETQVKGAGSFKNAPAQNNFSEKGEKAPAPVKSQATGVNAKSPVAESRTAKKRI